MLLRLVFLLVLFLPGLAQAQRSQEAWELLKMRQLDTARAVADLDVAEDPGKTSAESWYVRGMIYKSIYDRDDYGEKHHGEHIDLMAFDSYKRAIDLDATHAYTTGILEDVLALTEDFCRTGLDLFEKGYENRKPHDLAEAARYLDAVAEAFAMLGPRQVTVHKSLQEYGIDKNTLEVCRALAKDQAGQREDAARILTELVTAKSSEPAVYLCLKDYYLLQDRKGKALEVLERGRKAAPKDLPLALAYAELLADTGRAAEARTLATGLAKANPQEAAPLATLGFIEEKRSNPDKAEAYYLQAIEVEPSDFMANFRLGKLYFKRAEEAKGRKATQLYIRELQQRCIAYAEIAAKADPKHPGNSRILLELYNALGMADKAQQLKLDLN